MVRKPFEDDDPMELVGVWFPEGDIEEMAVCFVEEFVRTGMDDEQLLGLFKSPFYAATHRIYQEKGETCIRALITKVREQWGPPVVKEGKDA